jgi:hypothetical protein
MEKICFATDIMNRTGLNTTPQGQRTMLKVCTFQVDCTPPDGTMVGLDVGSSASGTRDPLYMRGVILEDNGARSIIAALDFCALLNGSYDEFRFALAGAVKADVNKTIIHCIHQHDAPLIDFQVSNYIEPENYYPRSWFDAIMEKCSQAAVQASKKMSAVAKIGFAETRLHGFASNRRVIMPDGSIRMRFSRCDDKKLKEQPVGIIDPLLRTVAFIGSAKKILASLSFYATHPQTCNNGKEFSADAPGEALRLLSNDFPDSMHSFFTGAAGNVGAGKYSSSNNLDGNRRHFGFLLAKGIAHNLKSMNYSPAENINWRQQSFSFPVRNINREKMLMELQSPDTEPGRKTSNLAEICCQDYDPKPKYVVRLLEIGNVKILFLPGEPFVEYQLFAQALIPDEFIATAANCNDNFLYLPTADAFGSGYETEYFCRTTEEFEIRFKLAVEKLLLKKT